MLRALAHICGDVHTLMCTSFSIMLVHKLSLPKPWQIGSREFNTMSEVAGGFCRCYGVLLMLCHSIVSIKDINIY